MLLSYFIKIGYQFLFGISKHMSLMPSFCEAVITDRLEFVSTYFQINEWLEGLMNERSEDLYRTKGVLSIHGWDERFVFQVDIQATKCFSSFRCKVFYLMLYGQTSLKFWPTI